MKPHQIIVFNSFKAILIDNVPLIVLYFCLMGFVIEFIIKLFNVPYEPVVFRKIGFNIIYCVQNCFCQRSLHYLKVNQPLK